MHARHPWKSGSRAEAIDAQSKLWGAVSRWYPRLMPLHPDGLQIASDAAQF